MSHHSDFIKEKRRRQRERNRRDWILFQHADLHRANVKIGTPGISDKPSERPHKKNEKLWSAKLVNIRNRLDDSKRLADDRWNRFAGTSDAGARGR